MDDSLKHIELLYGQEHIGIYDVDSRVCHYAPGISESKYREVKLLMPYIAALFDCGIPEGPRFQILKNDYLQNLLKKDFAWFAQTSEFSTVEKKNQLYAPLPEGIKSGDKVTNTIDEDYFHISKSGDKRGQPVFAGVQDKFMADIVKGEDGYELTIPDDLEKEDEWYGNVIVKPAGGAGFPFLCENEFIFMNVAREIGLDAPRTWLVADSKGVRHYCVERFGIYLDEQTGEVHKENMVDLLGVMGLRAKDKYRVYLNDMFECAKTKLSEDDFQLFCRSWYYQYFIGNTDIHPRNFSLFIRGEGDKRTWTLAPIYDIAHLPVYGYSKRQCLPLRKDEGVSCVDDFIRQFLDYGELCAIESSSMPLVTRYIGEVFNQTMSLCPSLRQYADRIRRGILNYFR